MSYDGDVRALPVLLLLLAGCDRLLGLGTIAPLSDAHADGSPDTAVDAVDASTTLTTCLSDDFSGTMIDTTKRLKFSSAPAPVPQVVQLNGALDVDMLAETPPSPPYNGLQSLNAFGFDDATFEIRLLVLPSDPNAAVRLYAIADPSNEYYATLQGSSLSLTVVNNGGMSTSGGMFVDPSTTHFLRLRTSGGSIFVDTAAAVGAWAQQAMHSADVPTTRMAVGFAAGIESPGTTSTQQVEFDDAMLQSTGCQGP